MAACMLKIVDLKKLRPSAWSRLLDQNPATRGTVVTGVSRESGLLDADSERYIMQLDGYQESAVLIGKNTNALEATFFADLSPHLSSLTPYCWLSYAAGAQSWVILDEVYNDWPMNKWTATDLELIVNQLILLHTEYWERDSHLLDFGLETRFSESLSPHQRNLDTEKTQEPRSRGLQPRSHDQRIDDDRLAAVPLLSEHALNSAGELAPILSQAASGLQAILMMDGWPGVIEKEHIEALIDIIDDPVPVLYPLRQAAVTLCHGNPGPKNWSISLFGETKLLNWNNINIGPGIYDLISFIEQYQLVEAPDGILQQREIWPLNEETIIDNYLLGMGNRLGNRFDARAVRETIPAARSLYILTEWLPKFNKWLNEDYVIEDRLAELGKMSDLELTKLGLGEMISLRQYFTGLFDRFLDSYHAL